MGIINTVSFFLSPPLVLSCSYVQAAIMKKLLGLPFLLQHTYIYLLKIDFILKEIIVMSELLFHWLIGFFKLITKQLTKNYLLHATIYKGCL